MAVFLFQSKGALDVQQTPGGPDLTGYLLTCAFVLALVLAAAWLFRRFISGSLRAKAAHRSLQVVDVLPLGGRQRLVVVRCYDRTFLLGQGEKEVRAITELDAEPESEDLSLPSRESLAVKSTGAPGKRAADAFAKLLGRASAKPKAFEVAEKTTRRATEKPQREEALAPASEADERPKRPVLDGGRGILG